MPLTLIIGPMKSGKSLELIARVAPYEYTDKKVIYVQPTTNLRDKKIQSRIGISTGARKISSLLEIQDAFDVIAIDEVHMFRPSDVQLISRWNKEDKDIFVCGLDLAYNQTMMPIIQNILELKPDLVIDKRAVCDVCKLFTARFTQILKNGKEITSKHPIIASENASYEYQSRCNHCFISPIH